jgi:hypothetical protein
MGLYNFQKRFFADMIKFWDGKLPFEGQIIHWRK